MTGYKINVQTIAVRGLNIEPDDHQFGRIRRLYVLPNYRNRGVGTKLVNYLINHACGYFCGVTVNIGRLPVEDFYSKPGFQTAGPDKSYSHFLRSTK